MISKFNKYGERRRGISHLNERKIEIVEGLVYTYSIPQIYCFLLSDAGIETSMTETPIIDSTTQSQGNQRKQRKFKRLYITFVLLHVIKIYKDKLPLALSVTLVIKTSPTLVIKTKSK